MQNNKRILRVVLALLLALPAAAWAQSSSLNTFSPYTFYGIGDFSTQGPGYMRSMGGAGIGLRNALKINYLNPASYSILKQKTFLFNVEIEGNNTYSKTSAAKTSHNSFNVRDIALAFPIARSLGIGISVTPMSSVGYRIEMRDTDPFFLANNMDVLYNYTGEGNVTQAKLGFGILLTKRLSVGADMVYYHGRISQYFNTDITSLLSNETIVNAHGTARESISRLGANIGLQYDLIQSDKRVLTFGATYRPRTNLKPTTSRSIYSTSITSDKITDTTSKENFSLPNTFTFGLSYQSVRLSLGLDYSMEQWNNVNTNDPMNGIEFKNNQYIKFGVQYIPNPMDVRHVLNRWSYRLGFRYNDYYMRINGHNVRDKAITLGVGIPIKVQGLSAVNVGVEFGQRGRTADGAMGTRQFRMIRENYIKLSIGLSLFGEDDWFKRFKYQ